MKYSVSLFLGFLIFAIYVEPKAQDSLDNKIIFPEGISLEFGFGNYALTDEYISKEKYSGPLPFYKIGWTKEHEQYRYQLGFEYRNSSEVKNYNIRADIYQFSLNQGFLYALPKFSLFRNNIYTFLGPSTELFFYYNDQYIAVSGFDYVQSFAALLSLGINSELFYPVNSNIYVESSLGFSLLSFGFRMVDSEESDTAPAKLLTLFSGINVSFRFGGRYYLSDNFSMKVQYLFNVTRISTWEPFLSASDNLIFTLTYGF